MTTPAELAERLGLENPRIFAQEVAWRRASSKFVEGGPSDYEISHRQQGHSTHNILAALCHLMDTGKDVWLVAHTKVMADLFQKQAGDWALQLGLDPRRIKATTSRDRALHGRDAHQVFPDHIFDEL